MIHDLRAEALPKGSFGYKVGDMAAKHLGAIESTLRPVLTAAGALQTVIGSSATRSVGHAMHKLGMPMWTPAMPSAHYSKEYPAKQGEKKVVYFPSCINQTMGKAKTDTVKVDLVDEMVSFLHKCGWEVIFPEGMKNLCCGTIWESKGMPDIADRKTAELEEALFKASEGGKYPVMCDQSPCLHRMREKITRFKVYEPVEFICDYIADDLEFTQTDEPVAVHVTCSMRKMGLADKIIGLAKRCSSNVVVPEGVGCCGFAGDKGFTHPELNEWALRKLRPRLEAAGVKRGFSNSRTCEIGLCTNTGVPYQSIVFLVDECSRMKETIGK